MRMRSYRDIQHDRRLVKHSREGSLLARCSKLKLLNDTQYTNAEKPTFLKARINSGIEYKTVRDGANTSSELRVSNCKIVTT